MQHITCEMISYHDDDTDIFLVELCSDVAIQYEVCVGEYMCTCLSFPLLHYFKHLAAVQCLCPDEIEVQAFPAVPFKYKSPLLHSGQSAQVDPHGNHSPTSAKFDCSVLASQLEHLAA